MSAPLARRLEALDVSGLTTLLTRRSDALRGLPPRDLPELADRLWHPHALAAALGDLTLPHLQLLEAAAALGDGCAPAELGELLDGDVSTVLDDLAEIGVLVLDGATIRLPPSLALLIPEPLGLGRPLVELLADHPVRELQMIQRRLGLPPGTRRADVVGSLVAWARDGAAVRDVLASAPPTVRALLAGENSQESDHWDPRWYHQRNAAIDWAMDRGMLVGHARWQWAVPAEITRALRGPEWRAAFTPVQPPVAVLPVASSVVETAAAAAAQQWTGVLTAVLDAVAATPLAAVKAGGVGARELTRLSRSVQVEETEARLALELAGVLGLLEVAELVSVSASFAAWRAAAPAEQFADAVLAWWTLPGTPTETRGEDGKALRALVGRPACRGCELARTTLLAVHAELDGAGNPADAAARVLWRRPTAHVVAQDETTPFNTPWHEAHLLGVIAAGAVSELGRALVGDDPADASALGRITARLVPAAADEAVLGADLTAYVLGSPSARVTRILDFCADRESRGAATGWRLTPASVRAAFDAGASAAGLLDQLGGIAAAEVPQPVRYLIEDVARRHGHLRVGPAVSTIRSEDTALLAEVAAHRSLGKRFGLRLVAPTVLAATASADDVLAGLRSAGYLPIPDDPDGRHESVPTTVPPPESAPRRRSSPSAADMLKRATDPAEVARSLRAPSPARAAAPAAVSIKVARLERELTEHAPQLSLGEVRLLAHALDSGGRVGIEYVASSGGRTSRVIRNAQLGGNLVTAWCELRSADRYFVLDSIEAVFPV